MIVDKLLLSVMTWMCDTFTIFDVLIIGAIGFASWKYGRRLFGTNPIVLKEDPEDNGKDDASDNATKDARADANDYSKDDSKDKDDGATGTGSWKTKDDGKAQKQDLEEEIRRIGVTELQKHNGRKATWKRFMKDFDELFGKWSDVLKRNKLMTLVCDDDKEEVKDLSNRFRWTFEQIKNRLDKKYALGTGTDWELIEDIEKLASIRDRHQRIKAALMLLHSLQYRRTEEDMVPTMVKHYTKMIVEKGGNSKIWRHIKEDYDLDKVLDFWEVEQKDVERCEKLLANRAMKQRAGRDWSRKDYEPSYRPMNCFNCGGKGHMWKTCTSEKKMTGWKPTCFRCGKEGHMSWNCIEKATSSIENK